MRQMNLSTEQKQTLKLTEQTCGCPGGGGWAGWCGWEVGVSRCKLLYMEWINKVLLYSTDNYIQYNMINIMEKNS